MKPSDTIKSIDKEHVMVNGAMIDIPKLRYWFESNSWSHHSPACTFLAVCWYCIMLAREPDYLDHNAGKAFEFFLKLAILAGYGFDIPDKVFSIVPKHSPWFRSVEPNSRGYYAIYWSGIAGNKIGDNIVITAGYFE